MSNHALSRRRFCVQAAAAGLALPAFASLAVAQSSASGTAHMVKLPDGRSVPALGQGCWHLGQGRHPEDIEQQALRTGVSLGMTLIDTSGNYGNGRSEELISRVLTGQRDRIFLVSKVERYEVEADGIVKACEASLARLGTDYLDLYLMHWPVPSEQLAHMVSEFEQLRAANKIRSWGVSNFDLGLMQELFRVPNGDRCATNQVPYSLSRRDIERDLLPWCVQHHMPVMAYSPLGGDRSHLLADSTLQQIGAAHQCTAAAVVLAWAIRSGNVIAIPESGSPEHTKENAVALSLTLTSTELQMLNSAFPGPVGSQS